MKKNPKNNEPEELAELFRMDFISNMKVADSELLDTDKMHRLTDPWRHEWNCGVQVSIKDKRDIRPPDSELIQEDDEDIQPGPSKNVNSCAKQYDADLLDDKWLILFNVQAKKLGLPSLSKTTFELAMEQLELASLKRPNHDNTCPNMIEHDDTVCDVCRSPTWEDGNKIVFCDSCNVAVHQMCYGIKRIPKGSWYCRPCAVGQSPKCSLCPNRGGAMKSNRSCNRWLHVSCALWVPEIEFENKETMEPAINFTKIPNNRFNLRCSLCPNRGGVCIQCSFKSCRSTYHVTCAQKYGLQLLAVPEFQSYCLKHADPSRQMESPDSLSQANNYFTHHKNTDRLADEPKDWITNTRHLFLQANYGLSEYTAQSILIYWRLKKLFAEIHSPVHIEITCSKANISSRNFNSNVGIEKIHDSLHKIKNKINEFRLCLSKFKQSTNFGMPLIRVADSDKAVTRHHEEQLIRRVQLLMFLRQNMEKARNLCYMIERREKLKRQDYTAGLEYIQKLHDNFTELKFNSSSSSTTSKSTVHRILTDSHLPNTVGFKSPPPPASRTSDNQMTATGASDKRHLQQFRSVNSKRVKTPSKFTNKIAEFPPKNHRLTKTTPPGRLLVNNNHVNGRPKHFTSSPMNFLRHNDYNHSQNRRNYSSNARERSTSKMKFRLDSNLIIDAKRQRRNVMPFSASV